MSALASVGIFTGDEDGRFTRTPLSECLRRDVPGSQRAMAVMMGEEHYQRLGRPPGERPHMARPPSNGSTASPIFDYLGERPEQAQIFDAAMTSIHGWETKAVLNNYDLSGVGVLADVGGGNGKNLTSVLSRYPVINGLLFDLPHVAERADDNLGRAGLTGRYEVIGGDFFGSIPVRADAYFSEVHPPRLRRRASAADPEKRPNVDARRY